MIVSYNLNSKTTGAGTLPVAKTLSRRYPAPPREPTENLSHLYSDMPQSLPQSQRPTKVQICSWIQTISSLPVQDVLKDLGPFLLLKDPGTTLQLTVSPMSQLKKPQLWWLLTGSQSPCALSHFPVPRVQSLQLMIQRAIKDTF